MAWKTNEERRETIYGFICDYAREKRGPTPNIREIALNLHLPWSTVHYHVMRLAAMRRLAFEDGKLIVEGSLWLAPGDISRHENYIE